MMLLKNSENSMMQISCILSRINSKVLSIKHLLLDNSHKLQHQQQQLEHSQQVHLQQLSVIQVYLNIRPSMKLKSKQNSKRKSKRSSFTRNTIITKILKQKLIASQTKKPSKRINSNNNQQMILISVISMENHQ